MPIWNKPAREVLLIATILKPDLQVQELKLNTPFCQQQGLLSISLVFSFTFSLTHLISELRAERLTEVSLVQIAL